MVTVAIPSVPTACSTAVLNRPPLTIPSGIPSRLFEFISAVLVPTEELSQTETFLDEIYQAKNKDHHPFKLNDKMGRYSSDGGTVFIIRIPRSGLPHHCGSTFPEAFSQRSLIETRSINFYGNRSRNLLEFGWVFIRNFQR
jgi:hypothetical protein